MGPTIYETLIEAQRKAIEQYNASVDFIQGDRKSVV